LNEKTQKCKKMMSGLPSGYGSYIFENTGLIFFRRRRSLRVNPDLLKELLENIGI
jgi:hypothetical protein